MYFKSLLILKVLSTLFELIASILRCCSPQRSENPDQIVRTTSTLSHMFYRFLFEFSYLDTWSLGKAEFENEDEYYAQLESLLVELAQIYEPVEADSSVSE